MNNIFIFIVYPLTLLGSYFLGRYSMGSSEVESAIKRAKKIIRPTKGMVIDYATPEEQVYNGSEQEKIDKQQTELIRESGIFK